MSELNENEKVVLQVWDKYAFSTVENAIHYLDERIEQELIVLESLQTLRNQALNELSKKNNT